jgi:phthalate 4,5-dioxygenase
LQGARSRAAAAASRYAVRSGGWVTDPSKDLAAVMTERFGHRHGYVGNQYGLGD